MDDDDARVGFSITFEDDDQLERLGQLIDTADNYLAAASLRLPAAMHVEGLTAGIRELRAEILAIYLDAGGENHWADRDEPPC
jgi:hypothetical protein